jgi:hypothetical protein
MPNVRLQPIDTLADLVIYEVSAECGGCGGVTVLGPDRLIQAHGGDLRLDDLKRRFKCARPKDDGATCGGRAKNIRIRVDTSTPGSAGFAQSAVVKIIGDA